VARLVAALGGKVPVVWAVEQFVISMLKLSKPEKKEEYIGKGALEN
jgi:hypothetical protein